MKNVSYGRHHTDPVYLSNYFSHGVENPRSGVQIDKLFEHANGVAAQSASFGFAEIQSIKGGTLERGAVQSSVSSRDSPITGASVSLGLKENYVSFACTRLQFKACERRRSDSLP